MAERVRFLGRAIIITNGYGSTSEWSDLPGTQTDGERWKKTLEMLRFRTDIYQNVRRDLFLRIVEDLLKEDINQGLYHYLVFVYCGHGTATEIIAEDGTSIETNYLIETISGHRCGTGVKKLMFFDSCRGSLADRGVRKPLSSVSIADRGGKDVTGPLQPTVGNTLVVYSTMDGYRAQEINKNRYAGTTEGLWCGLFTERLAKENNSLLSIIANVNENMCEICRKELIPQTDKASFQVAQFQGDIIGDVNLFQEACTLVPRPLPTIPQIAPPRYPPQASQPILQRAASLPEGPLNYMQLLHNYFIQPHQKEIQIEKDGMDIVNQSSVHRISIIWKGYRFQANSEPAGFTKEMKEDAYKKIYHQIQQFDPTVLPTVAQSVPPPNCGQTLPQVPAPVPAPVPRGCSVSPPHKVCTTPPLVRVGVAEVEKTNDKTFQMILKNELGHKLTDFGWRLEILPEISHQDINQKWTCQLPIVLTHTSGHRERVLSETVCADILRKAKEGAAESLLKKLVSKGLIKIKRVK